MNYWKWIEEMARSGVSVNVNYSRSKQVWEVTIGGHVRSVGKATASEAVSEAVQNMCVQGAKAVIELDHFRTKLSLLNKEAA